MSELEKELQYFIDHQDELVKKYHGRVLVIYKQKVVKDFRDIGRAYRFASKNLPAGKYQLQECLPGEEAYTHHFYSQRFA